MIGSPTDKQLKAFEERMCVRREAEIIEEEEKAEKLRQEYIEHRRLAKVAQEDPGGVR
jgi:DNA-directed RNA polymerase subunit H (RpoH/RPB5)